MSKAIRWHHNPPVLEIHSSPELLLDLGPEAPTALDMCRLSDARLDAGSLLAIESMHDSDATPLLRVDPNTLVQVVPPELAKDDSGFRLATAAVKAPIPGEAAGLVLHAPDDPWIRATCKSADPVRLPVPAVSRWGHAQKTVIVVP